MQGLLISVLFFYIFILIFLSAALYINSCYRKIITCLLNLISYVYEIIFSEHFADSWFYIPVLNLRFPLGCFESTTYGLLYPASRSGAACVVIYTSRWYAYLWLDLWAWNLLINLCLLHRVLFCFLAKGSSLFPPSLRVDVSVAYCLVW